MSNVLFILMHLAVLINSRYVGVVVYLDWDSGIGVCLIPILIKHLVQVCYSVSFMHLFAPEGKCSFMSALESRMATEVILMYCLV